MKRFGRANLVIGLMTAFTFLAFASSITGTLAWYAYSTRVVLSLTGTAVRQSVQLELGIVDDSNYYSNEEITKYQLTRVNEDGHSIVWNKSSSGLTSEVLGAYLNSSPYATSELSPVSTLSRSGNSPLSLYEAPETGNKHGVDRDYDLAKEENYVRLPFAFRVLNNLDEPVADQKIWITDAVCASAHEMQNAIRVFIDNSNANGAERYLFRPASSTLENPGNTVVAGLLDLDNDGYYDFDPSSRKEYIYGDLNVDGEISYLSPLPEDGAFVDLNGTGDTSQDYDDKTTFYSRHAATTRSPILDNVTYLNAAYETKKTVYPYINGDGNYDGGKPVAITPSGASKIAYCTLTIFVEGWDHAVIDQAVGEAFYLGLTFEINKVQDE